jgi:hypothetical protein
VKARSEKTASEETSDTERTPGGVQHGSASAKAPAASATDGAEDLAKARPEAHLPPEASSTDGTRERALALGVSLGVLQRLRALATEHSSEEGPPRTWRPWEEVPSRRPAGTALSTEDVCF